MSQSCNGGFLHLKHCQGDISIQGNKLFFFFFSIPFPFFLFLISNTGQTIKEGQSQTVKDIPSDFTHSLMLIR